MKKHHWTKALCLSAALALATPVLSATTIIDTGTTLVDSGNGFGNVLNVLSLQDTPEEFGSVTWGVGGLETLAGDAKNTSQIRTAAEVAGLGIDVNNFGILFNINDAGNPNDVWLDDFSFVFYAADKTELFTATFTAPAPLNVFDSTGTGKSGHLFKIESTPELAAWLSNPFNTVGAYVLASQPITDTNAGAENFFIVNSNPGITPVDIVPEPSMNLLCLMGLTMALGIRRRKR